MKILILAVALLAVSQPAFSGKWPSRWKKINRSQLTTPVTLMCTALAVCVAIPLFGETAGIAIVAVGGVYAFYSLRVSNNHKVDMSDVGKLVLWGNKDNLRRETIALPSTDYIEGDAFKIVSGERLSTNDVVAYEIFDHVDIGKKVLVKAGGSLEVEGKITKGFTNGFYEVATERGYRYIVHQRKKNEEFELVDSISDFLREEWRLGFRVR